MRVVEIRQESEWQSLKPAWERLLQDSGSASIFLTWEWLTAWWSAYGTPGELRLLAAFDHTDTLRGVAPLRAQTKRRYGQSVATLSFVGDGSNDSDYLDFVIAAGYESVVMAAFCRHWTQELERGTVLLLNEIPGTSPNLAELESFAASEKTLLTESTVPCATVLLPATWEEYLATLKPRFRTKLRSVLRNLEGRPEIKFGFCQDTEEVERLLPILFDLHAKRWALDGKPGVFGWDRKRAFYHTLSRLLLERGWLRFSWLRWNGCVLACQYGFLYGGKYFHLQEGYEPAGEHWNVGIGLRAWCFREFLKQGVREYDFLGGIGRHKLDWGASVKPSKGIVLAHPNLSNLLFCRGPEWETQARESLKKIVPQDILKARQARLEEKAAAAGATQNGHVAGDWKQKATAGCYFYLKLPALARPLRDRYQLLAKTKWPTLNRRMEASGRILYFHRVNDERDPFFPAISTDLFEQEMRFVAQHHKVVSLADLIEHLQGDSTEPVLAITFDDGYQDNYDCAFPILQRYNLPATIFLNTGSMDTREPLWFEQLALALKKTVREYIDLEIDLPRRFWTRTQAERIESNDRIFALLRFMPDADRRQWLAEILRQLAVADQSERTGKMLAWDHVRFMRSRGIDFGGHTVTHPFISRMTREQVTWEVSECKRRIEEELQLPVNHFAYPNGREEDFGAWNKEVIWSAGYQAAVTTNWGMNYRSTDRMELKRGGPWEESPAMFAYKLDWYQLVND